MPSALRSIWIWTAAVVLILGWLPLLAVIRVFDRDPVRRRTGRTFRRLGVALTRINPAWRLQTSCLRDLSSGKPFVVVSNHQSHADIPLIAHVPWEMKWVAKSELFRLPIIGWMLRMAGDIPVERGDRGKAARALIIAHRYLDRGCPVMIFPEGTRSPDGRVQRFTDGAFHLAIRAQVPIVPLAVEGSHDCLPKKSWRFGSSRTILLKALPPVETTGATLDDAPRIRERVRRMIIEQVAAWRGVRTEEVDGCLPIAHPVA